MKQYRARTAIANQLVEFTFRADDLQKAWNFAVEHFYPKTSNHMMEVRQLSVHEPYEDRKNWRVCATPSETLKPFSWLY